MLQPLRRSHIQLRRAPLGLEARQCQRWRDRARTSHRRQRARVLTTLLYAMKDRGAKRGLATLCLRGSLPSTALDTPFPCKHDPPQSVKTTSCSLTLENRVCCITPYFSCKHTITIAAKPHPKSACQLQCSLSGSCNCQSDGDYQGSEEKGISACPE